MAVLVARTEKSLTSILIRVVRPRLLVALCERSKKLRSMVRIFVTLRSQAA